MSSHYYCSDNLSFPVMMKRERKVSDVKTTRSLRVFVAIIVREGSIGIYERNIRLATERLATKKRTARIL